MDNESATMPKISKENGECNFAFCMHFDASKRRCFQGKCAYDPNSNEEDWRYYDSLRIQEEILYEKRTCFGYQTDDFPQQSEASSRLMLLM